SHFCFILLLIGIGGIIFWIIQKQNKTKTACFVHCNIGVDNRQYRMRILQITNIFNLNLITILKISIRTI
ncbi:MAG: hypothetical protein ACI90V_000666, partial [Bacillariaceae sp.]